jgi:small conductance mechanosensitive channel
MIMPDVVSASIETLIADLILFLPNLVVAILIFLLTLYVAGLAARAVVVAMRRRGLDPELTLLLSRLVRWTLMVLGTIWALSEVNFDITGFAAGLGILGFTVGFALRDIAENFVAGILLLWLQPFDIGDAVIVGGYGGTVTEIQIRATTIRTWDGLLVIVPNAEVYSNAITNYSKVYQRRLEIVVGVGYETDLPQAHNLMIEVVSGMPGVITDDPAPVVVFNEFGESSINATLYFWIKTDETGFFDALDGAIKGVKTAFEGAGINIPYPIRTLYMQQQGQT